MDSSSGASLLGPPLGSMSSAASSSGGGASSMTAADNAEWETVELLKRRMQDMVAQQQAEHVERTRVMENVTVAMRESDAKVSDLCIYNVRFSTYNLNGVSDCLCPVPSTACSCSRLWPRTTNFAACCR